MKTEFWLRIKAKKSPYRHLGWEASGVPGVLKEKPSVAANHVAVKVTLEIPDALFEEPQVHVKIEVPNVSRDPLVTADVKENLKDALQRQLGCTVHLEEAR